MQENKFTHHKSGEFTVWVEGSEEKKRLKRTMCKNTHAHNATNGTQCALSTWNTTIYFSFFFMLWPINFGFLVWPSEDVFDALTYAHILYPPPSEFHLDFICLQRIEERYKHRGLVYLRQKWDFTLESELHYYIRYASLPLKNHKNANLFIQSLK